MKPQKSAPKPNAVIHFRFRKNSPWVVCGRRLTQRMQWTPKESHTSCVPCLRQLNATLEPVPVALLSPREKAHSTTSRQIEAERLAKLAAVQSTRRRRQRLKSPPPRRPRQQVLKWVDPSRPSRSPRSR